MRSQVFQLFHQSVCVQTKVTASPSSKCRIVGKERVQKYRKQYKVGEHHKEGGLHEEMVKDLTPPLTRTRGKRDYSGAAKARSF